MMCLFWNPFLPGLPLYVETSIKLSGQISVTQKCSCFEGLGQRLCGISCIATADVCETTGFVAYRADTWMRFGEFYLGDFGVGGVVTLATFFLRIKASIFRAVI